MTQLNTLPHQAALEQKLCHTVPPSFVVLLNGEDCMHTTIATSSYYHYSISSKRTSKNRNKNIHADHNGQLSDTVEPLNVDTLKSGHLFYTGHFVWSQRNIISPLKSGHSLIRTLFIGPNGVRISIVLTLFIGWNLLPLYISCSLEYIY